MPLTTLRQRPTPLRRCATRCVVACTGLPSPALVPQPPLTTRPPPSCAPVQVQSLLPAGNTSLANWWNVYDQFNVWRTYGVGDPMPDLDNATFTKVQELANWLEVRTPRRSAPSAHHHHHPAPSSHTHAPPHRRPRCAAT